MRLGTYSVITCNANQPDKQYRRYVYEPCDIYVCVLYFFQKLVQYTCPYENPIARCWEELFLRHLMQQCWRNITISHENAIEIYK